MRNKARKTFGGSTNVQQAAADGARNAAKAEALSRITQIFDDKIAAATFGKKANNDANGLLKN